VRCSYGGAPDSRARAKGRLSARQVESPGAIPGGSTTGL